MGGEFQGGRGQGIRGSLDEILKELLRLRYTGSITVHLRGGVPQVVEAGKPYRYELIAGRKEEAGDERKGA